MTDEKVRCDEDCYCEPDCSECDSECWHFQPDGKSIKKEDT